jgi:hypothetical protein
MMGTFRHCLELDIKFRFDAKLSFERQFKGQSPPDFPVFVAAAELAWHFYSPLRARTAWPQRPNAFES